MGAALIAPVIAIAVALAVWVVVAAGKNSRAQRADATLPDEPAARRDEEIRRLAAEHAEADPANVTHPARRP